MRAIVLTLAVLMSAQPQRLSVETLRQLKTTSNDPAGDSFVDSPARLAALIDAFVTDSSLASPMYLLLAANTAARLERIEDAAFLLYAAQLRRAFDMQRFETTPAGADDPAIYLGFLNETTGMTVNPAVMRQPKMFASAISRVDAWNIAPSTQAYYPEFANAKGFKLPPPQWAQAARAIKERFLAEFGRPMSALLNDREYFEAFSYVQRINLGEIELTAATSERFEESLKTMAAAEQRLKGVGQASPGPEMPIRVAGNVAPPRVLRRVEPVFPAGVRDSVILEVTISAEGKVTAVRALRGDPALVAAAERAVREWEFEPTLLNGRAVAVLHTLSFTAR
jgi:TonB family protein